MTSTGEKTYEEENFSAKKDSFIQCLYCSKYGSLRTTWQALNGKQLYRVTRCEILKRESVEETWIICNKAVFDVTEYMADHPGGMRCLAKRCKNLQDTQDDYNFHSSGAKKQWSRLKVGELVSCDGEEQDAYCIIF